MKTMDRDILKAWLANGTILGITTVAEAEAWAKLMLIVLTCIYTALKCWKLARSKSDGDTETFFTKEK